MADFFHATASSDWVFLPDWKEYLCSQSVLIRNKDTMKITISSISFDENP